MALPLLLYFVEDFKQRKVETMNANKNLLLVTVSLGAALLFTGCSDKTFTASPESLRTKCVDSTPEQNCVVTCTDAGLCSNNYDYQVDAVTGMADILFVVDNSGSMSQEQREMGTKFPSFLNSVADLDYRIGITTTDISGPGNAPDANNGFGSLQDGKLIQFNSGQFFLDGSYDLASEQNLFLETIQRDETINCENGGYTEEHCPSGDERGILAAYMTMASNPNNFIREDGHMALIFLSDEDERSQGGNLESIEDPSAFLSAFQQVFPKKSIKAHSIVIRPGDSSCLSQQSSGHTPRGFYGETYAELSQLTGGVLGNICASNFSNQLQEIGDDVAQPREILPCRPLNDDVTVSFIPEPSYQVDVVKNLANNEILFSRGLPKDTKIRFQFSCAQ